MSSFGTKNQHHHHHHPQLRRQKTCFEVGSTNSNKLRDNITANSIASTKRGFCLQRQLSVDATSVIVNPSKFATLSSSSSSSSAYEKNNVISNSANDLTWKCGSNTSVNDHRGHSDHHIPSPKSSVVPIIKKRSTTQSTSVSSGKITETEVTDRHKKALKDRGNRLNLNIFLSHSTNSQDGDINGSDAESSNESMTIVNKENTNMAKPEIQSNCNTTNESNVNNNSCINNDSDNSNNISNNNQVPIKKSPDATAPNTKPANTRRPPLVRAMSAPIRPKNDDSVSTAAASDSAAKALQVKRKLKKKKVVVSRDSRENILEEKFDENDNELDDISNSSDSTSNILLVSPTTNITTCSNSSSSSSSSSSTSNEMKKQIKSVKKPTLQRPRSAAVGNEVVTLVSLLSSGGSDSEKEDNHATQPAAAGSATTATITNKSDIIDFNARHRAPLLRKSGKSVSFQERDLPPEIPSSTKDFSKYRRGSVAPIAARIRSNRPPTAPAGSIYLCDIDINNDDFIKSIKTSSNKTIFNINSNYDNDTDNMTNNNNRSEKNKGIDSKTGDEIEEIEINYPENVRTPKERECWKLYQKMLNRGVTVSYDTILRGMLTPTELRMIQKQNETRYNYDIETGACDGSGAENPVRDGNVNSTNSNNNDNNVSSNSSSSSSNSKELEND